MDDTVALRATVRRCTAVFVAFLASAFGPLSNYRYDGTLVLVVALCYLAASAVGLVPGEEPIVDVSGPAGDSGDESSSDGNRRDPGP